MYFDVYGPFELSREGRKISGQQSDMWNAVRKDSEQYGYEEGQLETAIGCYAFGLRNGDNYKPWYVGMTLAKGGFRTEVLQKHKCDHYDEVMEDRNGAPVLMLLPLLTPEGRFSRDRTTNKPLVEWVEKMLFGVALRRNPECCNQRDTKYLRNVVVNGIFNSRDPGRPGPEVTVARRMFGES